MAAGLYDFEIEQGITFSKIIEVFDVYDPDDFTNNELSDLTGWEARADIRIKYQSTSPIISLLHGDQITIPTPVNGQIHINLTSEETAALTYTCAVYDLELYIPASDPEITDRLIQGTVTLSREATK